MKKIERMKKTFNLVIFSKREFSISLISGVINVFLSTAMALLYGDLVSQVAAGKSFGGMTISIVLTVCVTALFCAGQWFHNYYSDKACHGNVYKLRDKFVSKLLHARYLLVASSDSSKYINNLNNDIESVVWTYHDNPIYFATSCASVIMQFVASLVLDWRIALSMVGFTVIMAILPLFIKKKLDQTIVECSKTKESYIGSIKENLLGLTVIKNNNAEDVCVKEIKRTSKRHYAAKLKNNFINSIAGGAGNAIRLMAILCLVLLTCYFVSIGEVQAGAVLSIYSIGSMFYGAILECSWVVTNLFANKGLRDIVEEVTDLEDCPKGDKISLNTAIELKNVTFSYNGGENRAVLQDVSMRIDRGGKYLVIGKSGSGKSTILKLLCNFYDEYKGDIMLDGVNYNKFTEGQVNELIAYCQQNGYLFNRSLRDNIDFTFSGNRERLEQTLGMVCLEEFIAALPSGLDTVIDEEVNQVSGGEKLRINLARSLYRDSEILLLDEVTSALDKKTSETVENNLLNLDKTLINVCHKFNDDTLKLYDRIFIIEDGNIVEQGSYHDLIDNAKFIEYRNLNKELENQE